MWDAQADALAEHFRVVRYDTRGHGGSPVPPGPYDIDDLADDVVALLDTLGVEKAHFVGLSLGGMTGMRLAARNPERVDRLVVLCTGARLEPSSAWHDRAATVRANGSAPPWPRPSSRGGSPRRSWRSNPDVKAACEAIVAATPAEGYASCCEVIAAMDLRDDLPGDQRPDARDRRRRRPGHAAPAPRRDRRQRAGRPPARRTRIGPPRQRRAARDHHPRDHRAPEGRSGMSSSTHRQGRPRAPTEAVADIAPGSSLAVGGFGLVGIPWIADRRRCSTRAPTTSPSCPTTAASTAPASACCSRRAGSPG